MEPGRQQGTAQVKEYDRYYNGADVWAIAFGCMVGWGTFMMPGTTFLPVAGPLGTLIAMVISIGIILVIGACYAYLMKRSPGTGGAYAYTKAAFGRDHAFLCAWFLCLSYLTIVFLNGTALFVVVRTIFGGLFQHGPSYVIAGSAIYPGEAVISVIALAAVGFMFIKAKAGIQRIHTVLSFILLAGTVLLAIVCIPHISGAALSEAPFGMQGLNRGYAIFSIVILAPWAFVGFDIISFETAHFRFEPRKVWKIIALSIVACAFAYTSMVFVSIAAVPEGYDSWTAYIADFRNLEGVQSVPSFFVSQSLLGQAGLVVAIVTALAAILTGMIGAYRAASRVLLTMAEDRILSEKFLNTGNSILFIMIISIVISFLGGNVLDWFVELTAFGAIIGFGYTSASAWKMAAKENNRNVCIAGITGTVITGIFAIVQLVPSLTAIEAMGAPSFLLLSLWCLLGFVFYWRTINAGNLSDFNGISLSGAVLFALLLYTAIMWVFKRVVAAGSASEARSVIMHEGIVFLAIVFVGLVVMLYIQNLVRKRHQELERERIIAVESAAARSQFLFNMSHDIRTPMNAILGYTKLARRDNHAADVEEHLAKIDISGRHLLTLIDDILEMSRIESGTVELRNAPEDLIAMMEEAKELFEGQMRSKGIDFTVDTAQVRNKFVRCDRRCLDRILLNILSNAYKFTPAGGSVTASLWEVEAEAGSSLYEIRVKDSGIGMSKEFAEKMFNAFERERTSTDSGNEGTGLGLAITKSLVDLMNGDIRVVTAPGAGTEFVIRITLEHAREYDVARGAETPLDKNAPSEHETRERFAGAHILVAEDNDMNREIAQTILEDAGMHVETAVDGQEAFETVQNSAPGQYDLVLMDIQMPRMNGYEAAKAIRGLEDRRLAEIPIIALTANVSREDQEAAKAAGMQGHIAKPIDVPVMLETISQVLRGSSE